MVSPESKRALEELAALVALMRAAGCVKVRVAGMEVELGPPASSASVPVVSVYGNTTTATLPYVDAPVSCSCGHEEHEHDPLCLHGCPTCARPKGP